MGKRREGREAAVQYLFQIDLNGEKQPGDAEIFWALRSGPGKAPVQPKTRAFTEQLVQGVMSHLEETLESPDRGYNLDKPFVCLKLRCGLDGRRSRNFEDRRRCVHSSVVEPGPRPRSLHSFRNRPRARRQDRGRLFERRDTVHAAYSRGLT